MGDRYLDGTNEFDSYGNKGTWGRSVMIDPELPRYVADAVWEVKTIDHKRE